MCRPHRSQRTAKPHVYYCADECEDSSRNHAGNTDSFAEADSDVPLEKISLISLNVVIWQMPRHIAQSSLGGRTLPSHACTLIALRIAELIHRRNIHFPRIWNDGIPDITLLPSGILLALVNGIQDGNEKYEITQRLRSPDHRNFTIPQALEATNHKFREIEYCETSGLMAEQLAGCLRKALSSSLLHSLRHLYFCVMAYERCVLIVVQRCRSIIGLVDSHHHDQLGATVMASPLSHLNEFVQNVCKTIFPENRVLPSALQSFEITALQFVGQIECNDCVVEPILPFIRAIGRSARSRRVFPPPLKPRCGQAEMHRSRWLYLSGIKNFHHLAEGNKLN